MKVALCHCLRYNYRYRLRDPAMMKQNAYSIQIENHYITFTVESNESEKPIWFLKFLFGSFLFHPLLLISYFVIFFNSFCVNIFKAFGECVHAFCFKNKSYFCIWSICLFTLQCFLYILWLPVVLCCCSNISSKCTISSLSCHLCLGMIVLEISISQITGFMPSLNINRVVWFCPVFGFLWNSYIYPYWFYPKSLDCLIKTYPKSNFAFE